MKRIGRIALLTLSILGVSFILTLATSHKVRAAVSALVTVSNTSANPVPTQSVDAENAFQTSFTLGFDNVPITIPSGKRLVIDFVEVNGFAQPTAGPVQPDIIFYSTLTGGGSASYYLQPAPSAVNIPGEPQFYLAQPVKIYADTLSVSGAYAGYTPSTFTFNVNISGHFVPTS
jgi:hypothetical protein